MTRGTSKARAAWNYAFNQGHTEAESDSFESFALFYGGSLCDTFPRWLEAEGNSRGELRAETR